MVVLRPGRTNRRSQNHLRDTNNRHPRVVTELERDQVSSIEELQAAFAFLSQALRDTAPKRQYS
ncbi:hypothetical protein KOR42_30580 [Thalassoglobus neptunius]|uniref:Uncharacterized protein n=1 Tax=Thalassoglobus neptunius TaxID=1938619 RepID=A0A5C5WP39_9PLAN|nr:hypothetical protein [Thalassoglobus neptunius]TWT52190.1 hypothetical protein KOR42_30580 [Thalassoglobus neptunius]